MTLPVLVGTMFVAAGIWLAARSFLSLRRATIVDGRVIYLDQVDQPSEGGTVKASWPVIEFNDASGEPRTIIDPYNQLRRPGDSVRVLYSPATGKAKSIRICDFGCLPQRCSVSGSAWSSSGPR